MTCEIGLIFIAHHVFGDLIMPRETYRIMPRETYRTKNWQF